AILLAIPVAYDIITAQIRDDPVGIISLTGPQAGCWPETGPTEFWIKQPGSGGTATTRGRVTLDVTFGTRDPICDFSVVIGGTGTPTEYTDVEWLAGGFYGTAPYTFEWYRDGVLVGTGSTYAEHVNATTFELRLEGTDALGSTANYTIIVDPQPECVPNPPEVECPVLSKRRVP
ncbi:MAG TPA: hypothetical protein VJS20_11615, partial [Gemmatimonadales bacterium]|nr:hypothetical protein [Gemmatimonadales bacterium]